MFLRRAAFRTIQSFQEQQQVREAQKQKDKFKQMVEDLSKKDTYTLKDFKKELFSQDTRRGGFFRKLLTEAQPEEILLEKSKKILNAFKDEELIQGTKFSGLVKSEVAQVSQTTIQEVNNLLNQFKVQHKLFLYLKSRRENGDYIPQTQDELMAMMKTDRPPVSLEEKYEHNKKFSTKQRKWLGTLNR